MMRKFYYEAAEGNFGDDLNEWLWDEVLPGQWDDDSNLFFSGIGTILSPWMPAQKHWVICGSGTGYGRPSFDLNDPSVFVAAVRGPLTAKALGLPASTALTDGAILLAGIERFSPIPVERRRGTIFVPHRSAFSAGNWATVCEMAGIRLVDPRSECETVIQEIRNARLVLADSMHAAIIADALRVPWLAVSTSPEINQFKWLDWALSVGVPYEPLTLPSSTGAEWWRATYKRISQHDPKELSQIEGALEMYARGVGNQPVPGGLRGKIFYKAPQRLAQLSNRVAGVDYRFADRAAKALSEAATKTGILSDESRSRSLLKRFQEILQEVRDYSVKFETSRVRRDRS